MLDHVSLPNFAILPLTLLGCTEIVQATRDIESAFFLQLCAGGQVSSQAEPYDFASREVLLLNITLLSYIRLFIAVWKQ